MTPERSGALQLVAFGVLYVGDVDGHAVEDRARRWQPATEGLVRRRHEPDRAIVGVHRDPALLRHDEHRVLGPAEAPRAARDDVEHGLKILGRSRHDGEDLADRRLPFQRLLRLVEQAHVLDRDDSLVREGFDDLDLARVEAGRVELAQQDRSDRGPLSDQRGGQEATLARGCYARACLGEALALGTVDVGDVDGPAIQYRGPGDGRPLHGQRSLDRRRDRSVVRDDRHLCSADEEH